MFSHSHSLFLWAWLFYCLNPVFAIDRLFVAEILKDRLLLLEIEEDENYYIVDSIPLASGKSRLPKEKEGDLKSPRGLYHIWDIIAGEKLNPLYGSLIYKLDFPNQIDQENGVSGSNIWLHGTEMGIPLTYTRGCLSISDENLLHFSKYLNFGTAFLIVDSISSLPSRSERNQTKQLFLSRYAPFSKEKQAREISFAEVYLKRLQKKVNSHKSYPASEKVIQWLKPQFEAWYLDWLGAEPDLKQKWYSEQFLAHSPKQRAFFFRNERNLSQAIKIKPLLVSLMEWTMLSRKQVKLTIPFYFEISSRTIRGQREIVFAQSKKKWKIISDNSFGIKNVNQIYE